MFICRTVAQRLHTNLSKNLLYPITRSSSSADSHVDGPLKESKQKFQGYDPYAIPPYVKRPNIGYYELIDLQIQGYDYAVLEKYQSYLHRLMNGMKLLVTKTWSTPHQELAIKTLKPNSSSEDSSFNLNFYERNLQIKDATVKDLPILIEIVNSTAPAGVTYNLHRHSEDDDDRLYIKDTVLENSKIELQELKDTPLIGD